MTEDKSAGLERTPWPTPGGKWEHCEGNQVQVVSLCTSFKRWEKGEVMPPLPDFLNSWLVKSDIPAGSLCVFFKSPEGCYVRSIDNFLERFSRLV